MKYMGSKNRIAKHLVPIIESYFEEETKTYIEPFVGGANLIDKIHFTNKIGSDNNKYLIKLLRYVSIYGMDDLPRNIPREHYNDVRTCFNENNGKYSDYYIGYVGFVASYNGRFFDGGYSGHAVGSKGTSKPRDYIRQTINNLEGQIDDLKSIKFRYGDFTMYNDIIHNAVIYCDPPYKNTKKYGTSNNFDYEAFYNWCRKMSKNNTILVSEYEMPSDFKCIWSIPLKTNMMDTLGGERKTNVEKLFICN